MSLLPCESAALDGDVLHVAEEIEAPGAAFASDAGRARAAERSAQVAHEKAVDPDGARDDAVGYALRARSVACVEHCGQAVVGAVGERDGLRFVAEGLPGE